MHWSVHGWNSAAERLLQDLERRLRPSPIRPLLTAMSRAVQPPQLDEPRSLIEYAGRVAATRAYIAFRRGDTPRTIELALQALEQLQEDQTARGLVAWYLGIAYLWSDDLAAGAAALTEAKAMQRGQTR